ncbi:MAG TPA: MFS transporter [Candidatus Nitrosotenuis sp.]|jgi:MFS family permease|nr:MFS transporter [Candidatus Nitrosotenuis sp.]
MLFPHPLRALNHRDYRFYIAGLLISQVGSWMQSVAQAWLVLSLTGSAFKLGLVASLQFAPLLALGLFAGALSDRLPKKPLILTTQAVLMAQAFLLAALVWSGQVRYWQVLGLALLFGLANALDIPARQAFLKEMVGRQDLGNAIALNSAAFNTARVVGPALAGLVVGAYGVALAFLLNGLSFLAVFLALARVQAHGLPAGAPGSSMLADVRQGVRFALGHPRISRVLKMLGAVSLFVLNYNVLVPLLARQSLHLEARGFGMLMGCVGLGAVAGAWAVAVLGRHRPRLQDLLAPGLALSTVAMALAAVQTVWAAAAGLFLMGFCQIAFTAGCNTTVQMRSPDALRGRVMSLYTVVFAGSTPLGAFLMGVVTELGGARAGFLLGGAAGMACLLSLVPWTQVRLLRGVRRPAAEGVPPCSAA